MKNLLDSCTFSEFQNLKFSKFPIPTCFITTSGSRISKRSLEVVGWNTITRINFSHILSLWGWYYVGFMWECTEKVRIQDNFPKYIKQERSYKFTEGPTNS